MKGVKGSFMAALMVFQPTLNGKVPVGYSHILRSNAGVIWCFRTPTCFCHALCSPVSSAIIFWEASWKPTSTDCAMCGARIKTRRSIQAFGRWFFSCTDRTLQFGEKNNHLRFLAVYIYLYITPKVRQHLQPLSIIWSKLSLAEGCLNITAVCLSFVPLSLARSMSLSSSSCFGPMFSWLHGRSVHHSDKQNGLPDRRVSKSIPAKLQWLSSCQWSWPKGTWSHNPWSHSAARSPECEQNIKIEAWYTTIMYRMLMSCGLQMLPTYRHPHLYIHKYPPQSKKALFVFLLFCLAKCTSFPTGSFPRRLKTHHLVQLYHVVLI